MKVLLVVHQFLPRHITGTEQYVRGLARGLRARGVDARVFAYEPLVQFDRPGALYIERDELVDDVPVRRVGIYHGVTPNPELRDYENPLAGRLLARWLDAVDFDLVHVFHLRNIGTGGIEEPLLRGLPVVVHLMDFWFVCPNYLLWRRGGTLCDGPPEGGAGCIGCIDPALERTVQARGILAPLRALGAQPTPAGNQGGSSVRQAHALLGRKEQLIALLARADRVLAPSRFIAGVHQTHGLPAEKIVHLPYGLDPERFAGMPARKQQAGRPHLDVGFIGSLSAHKGVQVLLEALRHTAAKELRVHLYGSRDSQPGFSEALVLGITDARVVYHGPFAPRELGGVLAGLDLLVVPSLWYENTPFALLEALHAGVPVIASDLGGIREIIADGRNGRLFPPGDARALARLLEQAAANPAVALVPATTKPPHIADNLDALQALYAELVARAPARRADRGSGGGRRGGP
ncbi:MAG TPA: glycosyltransferase [Planctomycetota bacterium]|nr:glycosyltransferase [Planctomycetota bacterium]